MTRGPVHPRPQLCKLQAVERSLLQDHQAGCDWESRCNQLSFRYIQLLATPLLPTAIVTECVPGVPGSQLIKPWENRDPGRPGTRVCVPGRAPTQLCLLARAPENAMTIVLRDHVWH